MPTRMSKHAVATILSSGLIVFLTGCPWPVHVPEPYVATGTWKGTLEPARLEPSDGAEGVTGIRVSVRDGPPLRDQDSGGQVPVIGFDAILVDKKKQAIPWPYPDLQPRLASVTGSWNSEYRHARWKGEPVLQEPGPRRVRDLYNVVIVTRFGDGDSK
jgi:hypothetical protein